MEMEMSQRFLVLFKLKICSCRREQVKMGDTVR